MTTNRPRYALRERTVRATGVLPALLGVLLGTSLGACGATPPVPAPARSAQPAAAEPAAVTPQAPAPAQESPPPAPDAGPPSLSSEELRALRARLDSFELTGVPPRPAGPIDTTAIYLAVLEVTERATSAQLEQLLTSRSVAIRAIIAREIVERRPADAGLVRRLLSDRSALVLISSDDVSPVDTRTTVAAFVRGALSGCTACASPPP